MGGPSVFRMVRVRVVYGIGTMNCLGFRGFIMLKGFRVQQEKPKCEVSGPFMPCVRLE